MRHVTVTLVTHPVADHIIGQDIQLEFLQYIRKSYHLSHQAGKCFVGFECVLQAFFTCVCGFECGLQAFCTCVCGFECGLQAFCTCVCVDDDVAGALNVCYKHFAPVSV